MINTMRKKWMPAMYVAYYPILQEIFNKHGYALCVHGSVVRDFDLIAVPFEDKISPHEEVLLEIKEVVGLEKSEKGGYRMSGLEPHGRMCYAIECGGGGYFDISFTPTIPYVMNLVEIELKKKEEVKEFMREIKGM